MSDDLPPWQRGKPLTNLEALALTPGAVVWMVYHKGQHGQNRVNYPVTLQEIDLSSAPRWAHLVFDVGNFDIFEPEEYPDEPVCSEMCGTGDGYLYHVSVGEE